GQSLVLEPDLAGCGPKDIRRDLEQSALAAAARPENGDELVLGNIEIDILERMDRLSRAGVVPHRDIIKAQYWLHYDLSSSWAEGSSYRYPPTISFLSAPRHPS